MKRKQIYIPEEMEEAIQELASLRGVPEAVIVREALRKYVTKSSGKKSAKKRKGKKENPLRKLIGLFHGGPKDGSVNHDYYLYGAPKKK